MTHAVSTISLVASFLYLFVAATSIHAAWTADRLRQAPWHRQTWLLLALLFVVLMIFRVFAIEEALRDSLRAAMRASGNYEARRAIQAPIISAVLVICTGIAALLIFRWGRAIRGRRNIMVFASVVAALSMLLLMVMRLTSLHMVDGLLYGPLKLNWVVEIGASFAVGAAAFNYSRLVRSRP